MIALAMRSRRPSGTSSRHFREITMRSSASKSKASRQGRQPSRWCWISTLRYSVSSPSRKWYSVWIASTQSVPPGTPAAMSSSFTTVRYQPSLHTELEQRLLERLSSTVQPTHHRADGNVEDLGDLLVREPLDIGQQHRHPKLLRQRLDRLLHLGVGDVVEHLLLGAVTGGGGLEAPEPAVQVEVLHVVQLGLLGASLLRAVGVDEGVGEDAVEPGLEVRALLEALEGAVGLEVRLLHEVLGVGRVARHAHRRGVQRWHVLHGNVSEGGTVGDACTLPTRPPNRTAQKPPGHGHRGHGWPPPEADDVRSLRSRARFSGRREPMSEPQDAASESMDQS